MTTDQTAALPNAWDVALRQFDLAADRLNLDPGLSASCASQGASSPSTSP